jgi:UDP-2,3-diacylglucosamine pyrophosphatase LpxH
MSILKQITGTGNNKRTLIISDVHLGSKGSRTEDLLKLLAKEKYDRLILVGDIIDGWLIKKYHWFPESHIKVIKKILKISKKKEVIYITGNHDEFLREYAPHSIGNISIVNEFIEGDVWIVHGDLYDGVVKLRWLGILGTVGYDFAIGIDQWAKKIGIKTSLSKFLKNNVKQAIKFITQFESELIRQCIKRDCNTVICGHIHTPSDKEVDGIRYLNTGDWIENTSYIIWEGDKFILKNYLH